MADRFAVVVGIEKYTDPFFKPVLFATEDAHAIADALVGLGVPRENITLLLNEKATATAIESDIRTTLKGLTRPDECFIFFAGHGYSDGFQNYLAAHDTRMSDLDNTSVRLQKVFAFAKNCAARRILLFLDACHAGLKIEESMRGHVAPLDLEKEEEICAGFASCRRDEKSYSAHALRHGIWTYHLLEALTGRASEALDGEVITVASLQKYLADSVPRAVRTHLQNKVNQTPRFFGSFEDSGLVADLSELLAKARSKAQADGVVWSAVSLVRTTAKPISSLHGFSKKRGHYVPERVTDAVDQFIGDLTAKEVAEDIDSIRNQLRTKAKFIRLKDLQTDVAPGGGSIRTPYFYYDVTVRQSRTDPTEAVWHFMLSEIDDAFLASDELNAIFGKSFDIVEFRFNGKGPNLRKLAEKLEDAGYDVELRRDETYVEFSPIEDGPRVRITPGSLEFVFDCRMPPRQLADGFRSAFAALGSGPVELVPLLKPAS